MSITYLEESEEYSDESESDLTPISDEEQTAGTMKRKREVSTSQTSIPAPGSRAEIIVLQGSSFRIERKQKAEGIGQLAASPVLTLLDTFLKLTIPTILRPHICMTVLLLAKIFLTFVF